MSTFYPSYPSGAGMPEANRPLSPAPVRNAVRVMHAGAVASLLGIVLDLATINATQDAMHHRFPTLTSSQLSAQQIPLVVGWLVGGLLAVALWVIIGRACSAGLSWARILGTVLFGIATIEALANLAVPEAALVKIYWFVVWAIGLVTVVLLWQSQAGAFFRRTRQ
jgi:hypothetical protein